MTADKRRPADNARLTAAQVLHEVLEQGAYANISSINKLEQSDLRPIDRRFASAVIYGTLSRIYSIDYLLGKLSTKPLDRLDPWVRTLLRMGAWQLVWSRSVPAPAAIDETVRLAVHLTNPGAAGLINAVLRRLSSNPPILPVNNPSVYYSLSPEIYGYLRKWYGQAEAIQLAESFLNDAVQVTARTNCLRTDPGQLAAGLQAEGIQTSSGRYCPEALRLELGGQPVRGLAAWQDGRLSIQDEAAMLTAHAAAPKAGQLILDICAAPGGKTCHLAEMTGDRARILAFDSHPERLKLVAENAARLNLASIECRVADATGQDTDGTLAGQADLVLADVPCSGLGLLARKPEIRLTMTHEKILGLNPLQTAILTYAASLVKPGGILIYSTCTINPAENSGRIAAFIAQNPADFVLDDLTPHLPQALLEHPDLQASARLGQIQLLPHRHGLDGFYIARLRRIR